MAGCDLNKMFSLSLFLHTLVLLKAICLLAFYSFDLKSFARKFSYNLSHFIFYKSFCSLTWNRKLFINATVCVFFFFFYIQGMFLLLCLKKKNNGGKGKFHQYPSDDMRVYRTCHLDHGPFLARFLRDLEGLRLGWETTPYMCYLFRYHMPWVFHPPFLSFFNRLSCTCFFSSGISSKINTWLISFSWLVNDDASNAEGERTRFYPFALQPLVKFPTSCIS